MDLLSDVWISKKIVSLVDWLHEQQDCYFTTNDGALAQQLAHPKFQVIKTYKAVLDKDLTSDDFEKIKMGIRLDDGFVRVDKLFFAKRPNRKNYCWNS